MRLPVLLPALLAVAGCSGARELRGMYSYMADAAVFTDCASGLKLQVVPEGDNLSLERAYVNVRPAPAAPVLVVLKGRVISAMPMEGPGPVQTLVPVKFLRILPGQTCP